MIKVESKLKIYEYNGAEVPVGKEHMPMEVHSHHNRDEYVIIAVGGKFYTVLAKDLTAAIRNATNSARF